MMTLKRSGRNSSFIALAGAAGAGLGGVDVAGAFPSSLSAGATLSALVVGALTGIIAGAVMTCALWFGNALFDRFGGRVPRPLIDGLISIIPAIPLGQALFSGRGISQSLLGELGPIFFPVIGCLAVWPASAALRGAVKHARSEDSGWRLALPLSIAVLAVGTLVADRYFYPGLYEYLHVLLALAAVLLFGFAFLMLMPRGLPGPISLAIPLIVLGMSVPVLVSFPVSESERNVLLKDSIFTSRGISAIWYLADLDGDGFSPVLGGGDCDDLDASVNPLGVELSGNRKDEDCDGSHLTPLDHLLAKPYKTDKEAASRIAQTSSQYPILLIIVDSLRADRIGDPKFPNLARMASQSIRYDRAYAPASSTSYSIPAIATGRVFPRPTDLKIAERFKAAKKRTAIITVEIVMDVVSGKYERKDPTFLLESGFDSAVIVPTDYDRGFWGGGVNDWMAPKLTDHALAMMNKRHPPDLIWLHYYDLHQWRFLKMEGLQARGFHRYDAVLQAIDHEIGRLLEHEDEYNVVLISDHGESRKTFHAYVLPDELVHVPLLIRIPGIQEARIAAPVGLTEIAPTLLHLAGLPQDESWLSRSLLGLIGVSDPGPGPPIAMFDRREWSLRSGKWRLIYTPRGGAMELYDVEADPSESTNLSEKERATAVELVTFLKRIRAVALTNSRE